jgi:pimeloyl-ACP methyl ester carboxylesterase
MLFAVLAASCSRADPATQDSTARDPYYPPALVEFKLHSHGADLNALLYRAGGEGPHPTAIFLHGYPGNERNLDLAQAVRRAGWNALYFHYRGAWGSGGEFSWEHAVEDALAAVAWISAPDFAIDHHADPDRIVLVGHSLGAWVALMAAAQSPELRHVAALCPWNVGVHGGQVMNSMNYKQLKGALASALDPDSGPLRGADPDGLASALQQHAQDYDLLTLTPSMAGKSLLFVSSTADEKLATGRTQELAESYLEAGAIVERLVVDDDHALSAHRIWLARNLIRWLSDAAVD